MDKENLDFPTIESYPKSNIVKVQNRLLEMADTILHILEKHDINYMIGFGTLLGAVRHQGFIPWDDDFDIFIFDDQYDKALNILNKKLPKDMIVHDKHNDPIYWPYWSRIRDLNSKTYAELYPKDNNYKYRGINFDLYRMDLVDKKDNQKLRYENYLSYYDRIHKNNFITDEELNKKRQELLPKYHDAIEKANVSTDKSKNYWFILGYYDGIPIKSIFPLKRYQFERHSFLGPNDADKLLTLKYGDYKKIPPYEKRSPHYTWVKFNKNHERNSNE